MRDTGCTTVIVNEDLIKEDKSEYKKKKLQLADGKVYNVPTVIVDIKSDYLSGKVEAYCFKTKYDVIIGNVKQAKCACKCLPKEIGDNEKLS